MNTHLTFACQHPYDSGFTLDASFELTQPITAICGPSGSGKTTTLSLIAGLLTPSTGKIQRNEQVLFDSVKGISLATEDRQIGLLFQDHCLFPHLSAADNIAFGQRRRRRQRQRNLNGAAIPVERVIQSLEIGDIVSRFPRDISGGQQQRVALARALAASPKLLLLDEPFNAVEPELQERLSDVIRSVVEEFEIPALLVSHNRPLLDQLADEVIEIRDGKITSSSRLQESREPTSGEG